MAGFSARGLASGDIAMVAHPALMLLIDLSKDGGIRYSVDGWSQSGSVVVGLLPGDVRASGWEGECLQIRLSPVAATLVAGAPADLTGAVVPLADIWGREAVRFEEQLRAATSWNDRFRMATDALGRRLESRRAVDEEVAHAWRLMTHARGLVRVDSLADTVGWSRKRLWSRFHTQLGLTPKEAAQLVRFDHAAHLLAAGHGAAAVAAESGYADQSHLHRDVKAITGATPTAVARAPWLAIDDVAWPSPHPSVMPLSDERIDEPEEPLVPVGPKEAPRCR
ncbi:MAG: helix-turn-helix domain-containing protein [bacterium]|nr:helix-turn-helix domain-containing protein [bacterium]